LQKTGFSLSVGNVFPFLRGKCRFHRKTFRFFPAQNPFFDLMEGVSKEPFDAFRKRCFRAAGKMLSRKNRIDNILFIQQKLLKSDNFFDCFFKNEIYLANLK